jgi:flagellar basal-body rod protein FlgC
MELMNAMNISAGGMKVQGMRMRIISENMANADSTPDAPGVDPYRRKIIAFENIMDRKSGVQKVEVGDIKRDQSEFRLKYDPSHPAADEKGYIRLPNVNSLIETMDMREAQRSYEANLGAIELSRSMMMKTIDLLRSSGR